MAIAIGVILLAFMVQRQVSAQCISNEFTIDEEAQNGTIVGYLFDRNETRALNCLLGLLPTDSRVDPEASPANAILSVLRQLGQPVLRDDRFAFRDGNLIVAQRIDRESICPARSVCSIDLQVSFVARTGGNRAVFAAQVTIRDKDDNKPTWQSARNVVSYYEQLDSKRREFLGRVVDADMVQNNATTLRFDLYDASAAFELLVARTGSFGEDRHSYDVFLVVKSNVTLDRETRKAYDLHVCVGQQWGRLNTLAHFIVETHTRTIPLAHLKAFLNDCIQVNVDVIDDNDNAPIVSPIVRLNVSEKTQVNRLIYRINATDPDEGANAELRFRFAASQNDRETFAIHDNGDLSIRRKLDYETTKHHVLKIEVFDSSSKPRTSTVEVFVAVVDENDEFPSISLDASASNPSVRIVEDLVAENSVSRDVTNPGATTRVKNITIFVLENVAGELVELSVTDRDAGENGQISCSMLGRSSRLIRFRSIASDFSYVIDLLVALDAENPSHNAVAFAIECTDSGESLLRTVLNARIELIDVNDNVPQFLTPILNASMDENLEPDSFVAQVHAEDPDRYEAGSVTYKLLHADSLPFRVDESNGEITTREPLDREATDLYTLRIVASDRGSVSLSATATVNVRVHDVNDHAPRFERAVYSFQVTEESADRTVIGHVNAIDRDAEENGKVTYTLDCDALQLSDSLVNEAAVTQSVVQARARLPFTLDWNSGEITSVGRLDRESRASYTFRVCAIDGGFPTNTGVAYVTVTLLDVNDNGPMWTFPNLTHYAVNVTQLVPIGRPVAAVRAVDADLAENGSVIYSIVQGNHDRLFQLDPLDGTLLIGRDLQPSDLNQLYRLLIEAADRPLTGEAKTATQQLVVIMKIDSGQLELSRLEQHFPQFAIFIVLAVGIVTILLVITLIVACIYVVQKKKQRAELRRKRRRNDQSTMSVSHSASRSPLQLQQMALTDDESMKENAIKNLLLLKDSNISYSDDRQSRLASPLTSKEQQDSFSNRTSEDMKSEINGNEALFDVSMAIHEKFIEERLRCSSRSRFDGEITLGNVDKSSRITDVDLDFTNRWVGALATIKSTADSPTDADADTDAAMMDNREDEPTHHVSNDSFPSNSASAPLNGFGYGRKRKAGKLPTFSAGRRSNSTTRPSSANSGTMTPKSDGGPTFASIHHRFPNRNPVCCRQSSGSRLLDISDKVRMVPVKTWHSKIMVNCDVASSPSNQGNFSKSRTCETVLSPRYADKTRATCNKIGKVPVQYHVRPPSIALMNGTPSKLACRDSEKTMTSTARVKSKPPSAASSKQSVSPFMGHVAHSPTTPCVDEYRPSQSATNASTSRSIVINVPNNINCDTSKDCSSAAIPGADAVALNLTLQRQKTSFV